MERVIFMNTKTIQLTSDSLGSLFTVPESDWTAISKRVSLAILAKDIAESIAQYLPDFPTLVTVCEKWKYTTFSGLVTQSHNVSDYSKQAIKNFTELQNKIAGLNPDDDLPATIKQEAENTISQLAHSTDTLSNTTSDLYDQVNAFTMQNNIVDAKIDSYAAKLGSDWQSIKTSSDKVDNAAGLVLGTWQSITDDLHNVTSGSIKITTAFLLNLDIQSAILAWQGLRNEADAFASMAKNQDQYLSGQWLNGN